MPSARPGSIKTGRSRGGDLPLATHVTQRNGAAALPDRAIDDKSGAIGWCHARAHHHGGAAAVVLKSVGAARDRHDRAVGKPPDTAGVIASDAGGEFLVL